jgi:transposase
VASCIIKFLPVAFNYTTSPHRIFVLNSFVLPYIMLLRQLKNIESKIEELFMQVQGSNGITAIRGVGVITAATFIAEVGDITKYEDPKQIQKLAGYNLVENSSGKHEGQTTISKRGRRRLRSPLYKMVMPILANNKEF